MYSTLSVGVCGITTVRMLVVKVHIKFVHKLAPK